MSSTQVSRRRGTTAQHQNFIGVVGEITYDTDKNRIVGHNGQQFGGIPHVNCYDAMDNSFTSSNAGGGANDITLTLAKSPTQYATYQTFIFKPAINNTGAVTVDINGLGPQPLRKVIGGAVVDLDQNDLIAGIPITITYDGTQFIATAGGGVVGSGGGNIGNIQRFTASGTWFKPANLSSIKVIVTGGGGSSPNHGGTSSFGSFCSATGGGSYGHSGGTTEGTAIGGDNNIRGGSFYQTSSSPVKGVSGASFWGGSGAYGSGGNLGASGGTAIKLILEPSLPASVAVTVGRSKTGFVIHDGVVVVEEYY